MKQTVNFNDFYDAFQRIRPDNFSYSGLKALFEYLEQLEEDQGTEIELDVIALCVDFSEYTLQEINQEFGYLNSEEFEDLEEAQEFLQDYTTVIPADDTIIIQDF